MVIIELFLLKLAFNGILQNVNETTNKDNIIKKERILKSKLSQLMIDYENGAISQEDYEKGEREVLSKLNEMTS
jgi:hypothetical protein